MMTVDNKLTTYGDDMVDKGIGSIHVRSHWNRSTLVVIRVGDNEVAVLASELQKAITNATNKGG